MRAAYFALAHDLRSGARRVGAASPAVPAQISGCAKASLNLVEEGQLSLATDNPAVDPWWGGGSMSKAWALNDPGRERYESAVAYGIAAARVHEGRSRGRSCRSEVLRAGKKSFDFYLAQVSNKPERRKAVTFSASYYVVNQAVAALKSNPISKVRSLAGLKKYRLRPRWGRRATTTSSVHQAGPGAPRVRHRQRRRHRRQDEADRRDGHDFRAWAM
jgi:polar amino acid transport system substrate-binding protein